MAENGGKFWFHRPWMTRNRSDGDEFVFGDVSRSGQSEPISSSYERPTHGRTSSVSCERTENFTSTFSDRTQMSDIVQTERGGEQSIEMRLDVFDVHRCGFDTTNGCPATKRSNVDSAEEIMFDPTENYGPVGSGKPASERHYTDDYWRWHRKHMRAKTLAKKIDTYRGVAKFAILTCHRNNVPKFPDTNDDAYPSVLKDEFFVSEDVPPAAKGDAVTRGVLRKNPNGGEKGGKHSSIRLIVDEVLECPLDGCDRTFLRKQCLQRHLLVHNGAEPFRCPHCDGFFLPSCSLI